MDNAPCHGCNATIAWRDCVRPYAPIGLHRSHSANSRTADQHSQSAPSATVGEGAQDALELGRSACQFRELVEHEQQRAVSRAIRQPIECVVPVLEGTREEIASPPGSERRGRRGEHSKLVTQRASGARVEHSTLVPREPLQQHRLADAPSAPHDRETTAIPRPPVVQCGEPLEICDPPPTASVGRHRAGKERRSVPCNLST